MELEVGLKGSRPDGYDYQKLQALLSNPRASRIFTQSKVIAQGVVDGGVYIAVAKATESNPRRLFLVSMLDKVTLSFGSHKRWPGGRPLLRRQAG